MPYLSAAENAKCDVFVAGDKELHALNPIGAIQAPLAKGFLVRYPEDLRQNAQKILSEGGWGRA